MSNWSGDQTGQTDASWWWGGGSWHDRRQNQRMNQLENMLAGQRSAHKSRESALRHELKEVRGGIQQQLDQLATAFDAFVELTEVTEALGQYSAEATARSHARKMLAQLVQLAEEADGRPVVDVTLTCPADDASGYWLPPAVQALAAVVRAEETEAEAHLETARRRDAERTDIFYCLGLLLAGRPDLALTPLGRLLTPTAGTTLTRAGRQLWRKAATGAFGEAGYLLLRQRLSAAVADLSGTQVDDQQQWLRGLAARLPVPELAEETTPSVSASSTPAAGSGRLGPRRWDGSRGRPSLPAGLTRPHQAARELRALEAWVDEHMGAAPSRSTATANTDVVFALVEELVDEGAETEAHLLQRAEYLRPIAQRRDAGDEPVPDRWNDPAGDPVELLRADATDGELPLARVAVEVLAPLVHDVADQLLAEADKPPPGELTVAVRGREVRFDPRGPVASSTPQLRPSNVSPQDLPVNPLLPLAGGGALTVIGLAMMAPALWLIGLAVAVAGGALMVHQRSAQKDAEALAAVSAQRADTEIAQVAEQVAEARRLLSQAPGQAASARSTLNEKLWTDGLVPPSTRATTLAVDMTTKAEADTAPAEAEAAEAEVAPAEPATPEAEAPPADEAPTEATATSTDTPVPSAPAAPTTPPEPPAPAAPEAPPAPPSPGAPAFPGAPDAAPERR